MVSTATPALRANSSIRYSMSDHSNYPGRARSAGGGAGGPVSQRHAERGLAGATNHQEGHRVARLVELQHSAPGLAVVEVGAVDPLDHVAGLDARLLGGAPGDDAAHHDAVALDRGAGVVGQVGGDVLVAHAH